MKRIFTLCLAVCITMSGFAQVDTTQKEVKSDTIRIGGMIILRDEDGKNKRIDKDDELPRIWNRKRDQPSNISTNWWIFDIGFSNYNDNTDYNSSDAQAYAPGSNETWFETKYGKSRSFNIWVFMQRINMIKHAVNLKYGVGLELNNYFYKQPIRYIETPEPIANPPRVILDNTLERSYSKNKLAADYLTVPLMINFNFTPKRDRGYGFSAGVSAGWLYSARNKTKTSDEGKEKAKDDFDLDRWKFSYVAEISLGVVRFYGSYAFKSMYDRGLDMTPYTFGFRFSNW